MSELDRVKRQLCSFNYKYKSADNTATVDKCNLRARFYARKICNKQQLCPPKCEKRPVYRECESSCPDTESCVDYSPKLKPKTKPTSKPKVEPYCETEMPDKIDFIVAIEQILCIIYNLKVAVVNDFLQQKWTPNVNTVKLAEQLCYYLECNPYIGYQTDCCHLPVKFFVYSEPIYHNKHLKTCKYIVRQEVVAIDGHNAQHSVCALSNPETEYIPDPTSVHQPNVTYLNALNCLEGVLKHAIKVPY